MVLRGLLALPLSRLELLNVYLKDQIHVCTQERNDLLMSSECHFMWAFHLLKKELTIDVCLVIFHSLFIIFL